jgi:formate hydrogenlyase transcriptional activator
MVEHCLSKGSRQGFLDGMIRTVLSTMDMQEVLDRTGKLLRRHFGATRVSIHRIVEEDPTQVQIILVFDPKVPKEGVGRRIPIEGSVCGQAIRERRPISIEGLNAVKPRYHEERYLGPLGYGAITSFPLIFEDTVLGTLDIAHEPQERLLRDCWRDAEQISHLIAIALHNSMMVEEIRRLNRVLDRENTLLKYEIHQVHKGTRYVAESPLMREVMHKVQMVASLDVTVLVRGETGTGKEGLARLVHQLSSRRQGPFIVVNLAAIPEHLIESELFGFEKGAFTGASHRKTGFFEAAAGGTIFLDEVGDAPLAVQIRLLRVLQEREIQRIGSNETIQIDVRVITATNRPLERMVEAGTFRSDLYYRLNIFPIQIPPLRERREDIRPLTEYFLARHATTMHLKPPALTEAELRQLEAYEWPGNVRELENYLARALIMSRGQGSVLIESPGAGQQGTRIDLSNTKDQILRFDEAVRSLLRRALETTGGKIYGPSGAAALLGLKPTTLQGKLRKHGIRPNDAGTPRRRK